MNKSKKKSKNHSSKSDIPPRHFLLFLEQLLISDSALEQIVTLENRGDNTLELKFNDEESYLQLTERFDDLMKQMNETNFRVIMNTANTLLEKNPLLFDIVCENISPDDDEVSPLSLVLCEMYYLVYEKLLPDNFELSLFTLPWEILDNRPLLRFLHTRAQYFNSTRGPLSAIPYYEELLALNPHDNQGVREDLVTAYLLSHNSHKVITLAEQYPNDISPNISIGLILALYKLGQKDNAEKQLKKNYSYCSHVVKEILQKEHTMPENSDPYGVRVGGPDEAYFYWLEQGYIWEEVEGARSWLKKITEKW